MGFLDKMKDAASQAMSEAKSGLDAKLTGITGERQESEAAPVAAGETPLYEVVSHIAGKNAKVRLYADRIEWERPRGVSGAKMTAAAFTAGTSLLVTGVKGGKEAFEMVSLRHVTNVSTRKDGMMYHLVEVQTAVGAAVNTVDFRVGRDEALEFRKAILSAMDALQQQGNATVVVQAAAAPAANDAATQIQKLSELHAQGILSDEEFTAAKAKALGI
ncbi:SHOCT domain-containing protein [Microbacterium sp. zg.Y1084]|uniref:SHOCT domain-containing protein n=1 Tax=Microbacterium sp. zg.Y1084 TaxID=2969667 RepID=UPI00214CFFC1|nr:SHOCT domain-containing protein [Microbacterium sp. zg.Y1084]MCR2812898.1 SHOCT domain-containing protein [Microbacterium sp. zg.Y1084]